MEELKVERESKSTKLLSDLNFEEGLKIDGIIEIEIKQEKLKIPETTINAIKKSRENYSREILVSHFIT